MGELPESHTEELLPATEVLYFVITLVTLYTCQKIIVVNKRNYLTENILALVHEND